ncbi:ABC transporter ATP-binding protein [Brumimicrobium aurantiacum]|uniref:ABC transporter ATP-binding protein n=1 Tax=Brumimicrobium aurantiacum TaxID=1737063 RepID=A0A3E1EW02_9FLAO|nr:ABC transporter ATP-binding protein [Brumimicrobium aurantiacum]RFC53736.1 ABC transporter ATP-binding protein [Brumimicrobium aurantiacum]
MSESKKTIFDFYILKRLFEYVRPYRKYLILAFIFTIGLAILSPLRPSIIGNMVDEYIEKDQNPDALWLWTMVIIGMLVLEAVFQFFTTFFANLLAQSLIKDIRIKLYRHMMSFKMKYFDQTPIGSVVTRVISDLEAISEIFSQGLINMFKDVIILVTIIVWMFVTDSLLTLYVLLPIPLLLIATRIFAKAMKKAYQKESVEVNRLNTFVQERLTGMSILQLFNREKVEKERFSAINERHKQAHIDTIWANSIFFPVVEFLSSLSIAFLIVFSAWSLSNEVSITEEATGVIVKFTLWVNMLYRPIRQLADKFNVLQRGVVRAERVFKTLDTDEVIQDEGDVKEVDFQQNIQFKNVWFAYQDEDWVLKDINLDIKPNQTVAFVGATGAGKSSIVNLLSRFYEYQKGTIQIGESDIRSVDLNYLRQNISIVLQDVFLFSNTILNNITLGDENITKEQVVEAAKAVGAHDFIMKLPNNYDYEIGERGGVLSTGQQQLLAFIRAYVFNPHILILDEATSSVDNESEEMIQKATEKLTVGRTSIVIAHRLSTIQSADKIVVLDQGRVMEAGNHQELLSKDGFYKNLYEKQFLGDEE